MIQYLRKVAQWDTLSIPHRKGLGSNRTDVLGRILEPNLVTRPRVNFGQKR